jgi:hypothetical protein
MNSMPEKMKNILHKLMLVAAWLTGSVFFFFLSIYIAISFLTKGLRKLLKRKGLYHFREQEFPVLNVMHDSGKNISIGKLPVRKGEIFSYRVPVSAKEVLLEFKLNSYPADSCIEFDYCLWASALKEEFIYIFINPFDSMQVSYDKALVWYPVPDDGILKVQFADVKQVTNSVKNIEGNLSIVQIR